MRDRSEEAAIFREEAKLSRARALRISDAASRVRGHANFELADLLEGLHLTNLRRRSDDDRWSCSVSLDAPCEVFVSGTGTSPLDAIDDAVMRLAAHLTKRADEHDATADRWETPNEAEQWREALEGLRKVGT